MLNHPYPLVSIVSINYNNSKVTCELLESLRKISYRNIEIIIVDNASSASIKEIENSFPEIILIKNPKNEGFAGGNNRGIQKAKGKYVLMLNNDTEVHENFLEPLVEVMENNAGIGAISPKICYFSEPNMIQFAGGNGINLFTGRGNVRGKNNVDSMQYNDCKEMTHGHGAALMISKEAIEKAGLLYEGYFLCYEELDYCEKLRKAGFKIWYTGNSKVLHKESMSIGKDNPFKTFYLTRNRLIYLKRNAGGLQYSIALLFFFTLSLPKNVLAHLLKGKPEMAIATLKGVRDFISNKYPRSQET